MLLASLSLWNIYSRNVPIFIDLFDFLLLTYSILIYSGYKSCIWYMDCKYFSYLWLENLWMEYFDKQKFNLLKLIYNFSFYLIFFFSLGSYTQYGVKQITLNKRICLQAKYILWESFYKTSRKSTSAHSTVKLLKWQVTLIYYE